jgi:adenylosuccinate synthase
VSTFALIGGQYGSEGKGVIAAGLAHHFGAAVRTGGPNAGHSLFHQRQLYKMRQVPCAWVSPGTQLYLGAGAVVNPMLLEQEAKEVGRTVFIDPQATLVLPQHEHEEVEADMRALIGSTTEGVGAARVAKIERRGRAILAGEWKWDTNWVIVDEIVPLLAEQREWGRHVFLEGTQGSGLSLHHGHYPFVTSADTNAAQLAADAGIAPSEVEHTHLVVRTHPIRVAGNSGPTGGVELAWDDLISRGVVQKPEQTTVTKLQRRLFTFDAGDVAKAIALNDPCGLWITFGDYIDPEASSRKNIDDLMDGPFGPWYRENIAPLGVRLMGVGVGGDWWRVIETGDACDRPERHHNRTWPLAVYNGEGITEEEWNAAVPF